MRYNRKSVSVITAPTTFAVTVEEAGAYIVDLPAADWDIVQSFIEAAQDAAKQYLNRAITQETLRLTMDGFGYDGDDAIASLGAGWHTASVDWIVGREGEFDLPYPPTVSVTSITTFNRQNVGTVFSDDEYELDAVSGRVYLNEGRVWPLNLRSRAAVQVDYVAGYTVVPPAIKQGILQHVAAMYDCRSACAMPEVSKSVMSAYRLISPMGME